jgi:hypothetical protein
LPFLLLLLLSAANLQQPHPTEPAGAGRIVTALLIILILQENNRLWPVSLG